MTDSSGGASRYWELTIPASTDCAEGLANFLWELGALGVVEEDVEGAAPQLRAFFPDSAPPVDLAARLRHYVEGLATLGFDARVEPRITPLVDGGWADAWRAHFRPVEVGQRLVVAPPWNAPPANGRLIVIIEPGRAFGTGHHGTTAGCLQVIETIVDRSAPEAAIDLGTGSGILAIAAARLGVTSVVAVDEDPDAVAAAVANAARNGVCDRVRCSLMEAAALETPPAPLVIANLLAAAHHRLGGRYRAITAPGGTLVLGGILDGEADAVSNAIRGHGFQRTDVLSLEGWTTLVFQRDAAETWPASVRRATLHDRS